MIERPTSVTVLGTLNICFGILGSLSLCCGAYSIFAPQTAGLPPFLVEIYENPIFRIWSIFSMVAGGILSLVLIAAGVLLLQMKREGRILSLGYAWTNIALGAIGMLVNAIVMFPAMSGMISQMSGGSSEEAAMKVGMTIGMVIGIPCGTLCGLIYPILLIYFLSRPLVRQAFDQPHFPSQGPWLPPGAVG